MVVACAERDTAIRLNHQDLRISNLSQLKFSSSHRLAIRNRQIRQKRWGVLRWMHMYRDVGV